MSSLNILLITFIIGFFSLYLYRSSFSAFTQKMTFAIYGNTLKELENKKIQEEEYENFRIIKFEKEARILNNFPVLNKTLKWIYKEGFFYLIVCSLIILAYTYLLLSSIGTRCFYVDELFHALIVKNWIQHHEMFKVGLEYSYTRGAVVSLLAIVSNNILPLYNDEFSYRLPVALCGIINIFFVYILAKELTYKKNALLVTALFATDILFFEFARYLRFYTISITVILILLLYLIKNNYSIQSIFIAFCFSLVFTVILTEYFLFIASFFGLILMIKLFHERKQCFYYFLIIFIILFALGIIYKIIQMESFIRTYNILDYNLYEFNYTIGHLKWLSINYFYVLIGIVLSLPLAFNEIGNIARNKFSNFNVLVSFNLFNLLIIFGYIDHVKWNFSFRPFLFVLPTLIIISILLIQGAVINQDISGNMYKYFNYFMLLLIILNASGMYLYSGNDYGDKYYPYKLVFEHAPIVIDKKTTAIFLETYIQEKDISDYSIFIVGLNEYPFVYYTNLEPNYLVRWKGSNVDGLSKIGIPVIWEKKTFMEQIKKEKLKGNDIFIIATADVFHVENHLNELIFNSKYVLETPEDITQILNDDFKDFTIYTGKDNISCVYFVPKNADVQ